jgi:hypothetical protein
MLRNITNIVLISKTNILQCWVKFEGSINFLRKLLDYSSFFFHKYTIFVANHIGHFWNFCRCDFETTVCSYVHLKFNVCVLFHFSIFLQFRMQLNFKEPTHWNSKHLVTAVLTCQVGVRHFQFWKSCVDNC